MSEVISAQRVKHFTKGIVCCISVNGPYNGGQLSLASNANRVFLERRELWMASD